MSSITPELNLFLVNADPQRSQSFGGSGVTGLGIGQEFVFDFTTDLIPASAQDCG